MDLSISLSYFDRIQRFRNSENYRLELVPEFQSSVKKELPMAYDKDLANRVDAVLDALNPPKLVDKKMFGGIGFLVRGNMACGVIGKDLIVRVGKNSYPDTISLPETKPFDITGRAMTGWVMVPDEFLGEDEVLAEWVQKGLEIALSLPEK
jgi:TfoX/Sxy family transcriptional regulator of competence genes